MANNYDFMFKFIIIGDSSVGKSCLLLRFTQGRFKTGHQPTLGVQFGSRSLPINGYTIKVQLWDTAGQQSFKSITRSYYKSSIAAFLVFDLTKRDSFESISKWMMQIKNNSHDRIQTVLIGNKIDLKENREVTPEEAQKFADANQIQYFQTSAQSGIRVQEAFKSVAEKIVKMIDSKQINPQSQTAYGIKRGKKQRSSSVSPTKSPPQQGKSSLQFRGAVVAVDDIHPHFIFIIEHMNERFTFHSQIEHRNLRYTGTGTADTTKWEYGTNLRRDALSSHLSHFSRMVYFSAIENQSITRLKNRMLEDMLQPCGPPPPPRKKGEF